MNYQIVPMDKSHLDAVERLERLCFPTPWSRTMLEEELYHDIASYLVAETDDGQVIGYSGVHVVLDEGHITNVCVDPQFRRQGVAEQLLGVYLRFGQEHLRLLDLEVRVSNAPAIALYEKLGFAQVGLRPNYCENPREDAYIMSRHWDRRELS